MSGSRQYKWLFGAEKSSGLSRNARRIWKSQVQIFVFYKVLGSQLENSESSVSQFENWKVLGLTQETIVLRLAQVSTPATPF